MTTPTTSHTTLIRVDMDRWHTVSDMLDGQLQIARREFDMSKAMEAYRDAYRRTRDLLSSTLVSQIEDAIIAWALSKGKDAPMVNMAALDELLEAREQAITQARIARG